MIKLPIPVSVNQAYAGYGRRYKSKKYKDWEKEAKTMLDTQDLPIVAPHTPLIVKYVYHMPCWYKNGNHKKIDVFNYEKALSDFLEHNLPGFEDEYIYKGVVEKIDSKLYTVYIEIEPYNI